MPLARMFETAEIGNQVSKRVFEREAPKVRTALLAAQKRLATSSTAVIILIGGVEGAGKAETVNLLLEWLDARGIQVHAMWDPSDEERERPPMWRFWRVLPPSGRIGIFFGSWYTVPIIDRVFRRANDAELDQALDRIIDFERMLAAEGTLLLKFWFHLAKDVQRRRLKELQADPRKRWRVTKTDWKFFKKYDRFREICERALRRTSTGEAPWTIVEATDARYRSLTVTQSILRSLEERLDRARSTRPPKPVPDLPKPKPVNILSQLDLSKRIADREYRRALVEYMGRINLLSRRLYERRRSLLLVFEGPDAAGKGGAIRRLISAVDARNYQVHSVAAPSDEERARPYLWRFWRHLPRLGRITIFDRSWYGRVLVERIEGLCPADDWKRAYAEINAFEAELAEFGIIIVKFWLMISAGEQLRRFKTRELTPYTQYKLTEEDWRNRSKWDAYVAAACEMIERTSTNPAPWMLVQANDKNHARIKVMKTVHRALKQALRT
ncbi:MAG TPA: polyphosphate:AMP phosphotransferase [Candidatus Binatia bacterium]|nr:polyphosphate:AMP phosphotransferase [Candidatus Binatia bacterium]